MIRARGLSRLFAGRDVIGSLDLDVDRGERVALRGPNGSGKTTALRCVAGTLRPSAGDVTVGGHRSGTVAARSLLGLSLAQERSFDLRLSGRANLLFFARLRLRGERAARTAVEALVDELELAAIAAQRVANSSSGMVQQLALARALLGDPPAVLLDEPTRSLDEEARGRLWDALDRRPGLAVLLTTHSDEDAARCRQTIALGAG
jgi:ABC-type multidrug transport system ATPase subunit